MLQSMLRKKNHQSSWVKLDMTWDSPLKGYNFSANIGGVLLSKGDTYIPYYYSRHILLVSDEYFDIALARNVWYTDDVFEYHYLSSDLIDKKELYQFIGNNLRNGYYISAPVNEYYVPHRDAYQNYRFFHDIFIYGTDDEQRVYFTAGYNDTHRYNAMDLDQETVIHAIADRLSDPYCREALIIFRPKAMKIPKKLNIPQIRTQVEEFLNSRYEFDDAFEGTYGLAAYTKAVERIKGYADSGRRIRYATFHTILEHKAMMLKRLEMLEEKGVPVPRQVVEGYQDLEKIAKRVENLYLKYEISGDKAIIDRICGYIESIRDKEAICLKLLLECLQQSKG